MVQKVGAPSHRVGREIPIDRIHYATPLEFSFTEEVDWVQEVLGQVHQHYEEDDKATQAEDQGKLAINLRLKKIQSDEFGVVILLEGELQLTYKTYCARCLENTHKELELSLKVAFVDQEHEGSEWLGEQLLYVFEQEEYEVYFYRKSIVHLADFIYEQIILGQDPFPLHAEDCQGLCQVCGQNLNQKSCHHASLSA